jgi:hypothetical protein
MDAFKRGLLVFLLVTGALFCGWSFTVIEWGDLFPPPEQTTVIIEDVKVTIDIESFDVKCDPEKKLAIIVRNSGFEVLSMEQYRVTCEGGR